MLTEPSTLRWSSANRQALLAIGVAALAARVLFIALGCTLQHHTLQEWAAIGDGLNYIHYADRLFGNPTEFSAYDARVFPGLPALMGLLTLIGIPAWLGGIVIGTIAGALVAVLTAVLCEKRRIGWMLAVFPPIFLVCSVGPTTEPLLIALCLLAFLIGRNAGLTGVIAAGLAFGYAGTVRPVACFAVLGLMSHELLHRRLWRPLLIGAIAACIVGLAMLLVRRMTGDALYGVKYYAESDAAYRGDLLTWPFKSLIFTPFYEPVGKFKLMYVWMHVLAVFATLGLLVRSLASGPADRKERAMDIAMLVWLAGNTLFVLCVGNKWGLQAFPRFALPALPPMCWAIRRMIPRSLIWFAIATVISFALALRHIP